VARAQDLLRHTDLSVTAVAARLGFANPFHFARAYRRQFGRPPSADRATG
jgi:AraC family transcriptional regulator of arabinose operon